MNKQITLLIFFFIFNLTISFACNKKNYFILKVNARDYPNCVVKLKSPYFNDSIVLDNLGVGKSKINFNKATFAFLTISKQGKNFNKVLILSRSFDLTMNIVDEKIDFIGIGSDVNKLQIKSHEFWEKASNDINFFVDKTNSIDSIVEYYNMKENQYINFFSEASKNTKQNKNEVALVRGNFLAKSFSLKQSFMSTYFTYEEADSLNLNTRFGFANSNFYKDSILIKSGSPDLMNFLSWNFDFRLKHDLSFEKLGFRKYSLAIDSLISNDFTYGRRIKEYLFYHNISSSIYHFGKTQEVEQLIEKLKKNYPDSRYINLLLDLGNKFDQLKPGNKAPDFTVENRQGQSVKFDDLKGKIIFIDVWATWCSPCIKKMPTILKFQKEFKDIHFIFLSIDNDKNSWDLFLKNHPEYEYSANFITGNSNFNSLYRISSIPRYIIIDKQGAIVNAFIPNDETEIHDLLVKLSN